jgi:hypothetical protein
MFKKVSITFFLVLIMFVGSVSLASADTPPPCAFEYIEDPDWPVMKFYGNCTTDHTIIVPDRYTLDGLGGTITAVDPVGGHFVGAVIEVEPGSTAFIKEASVDVSGLANVCDSGDDRLKGIWFNEANGVVTYTTIIGPNQGQSGCQEGNAIEVRNPPYDGTHPGTVWAIIDNNTITGYQKTGILVNGDVAADVWANTITGFGPVNYIAQNGIQLGWGAMGSVYDNIISGNEYTGSGWTSAGILLFDVNAPDLKIYRNTYRDNQKNLSMTEDSACPNMYGGFYSDYGLCE